MSQNVTLGRLINGVGHRDAIHVAVAPVIADCELAPAQPVGLVPGRKDLAGNVRPFVGIVDPFLRDRVIAGDPFYLLLFPDTITSLRHEWTHPAFYAGTLEQVDAEVWLREFAGECRLSFETVIQAAHAYLATGEFFTQHGTDAAQMAAYGGRMSEFWRRFEIYTGTKADCEDGFFRCTC